MDQRRWNKLGKKARRSRRSSRTVVVREVVVVVGDGI